MARRLFTTLQSALEIAPSPQQTRKVRLDGSEMVPRVERLGERRGDAASGECVGLGGPEERDPVGGVAEHHYSGILQQRQAAHGERGSDDRNPVVDRLSHLD